MKIGDTVVLTEDSKKEQYTVVKKMGLSKGPIRQFNESRVWRVTDSRERVWDFREDALTVIKNNK